MSQLQNTAFQPELQRQYTHRTVSVLAAKVQAGTSLARASSIADSAKPDESLAADLVALELDTLPNCVGPATTDFQLTLSSEEGTVVHVHRAILIARSKFLRELVLSDAAEAASAASRAVSGTLDIDELRAAVHMCYVGEAHQWAVETADKQLAEEKRVAAEAPAGPPPLPEPWIAQVDQSSGRTYYANTATHKTTWERPVAP
jgi:hypothetical protein